MKTFMGELCKPAGIYLFLSILVVIITAVFIAVKKISPIGINFVNSVVSLVFVIVWTYILNFLCNRVSITLVWVLVIINFVLLFLSVSTTVSGSLSFSAPAAHNEKESLVSSSEPVDSSANPVKRGATEKGAPAGGVVTGASPTTTGIAGSIADLQNTLSSLSSLTGSKV